MLFFFFNDTATTEIYTLSLHDALPILSDGGRPGAVCLSDTGRPGAVWSTACRARRPVRAAQQNPRSAPPPRATLQPEPSAAVLGSRRCDLLPEDHHLHRRPARPPEHRLWRLLAPGAGGEHAADRKSVV